MPQVKKKISLRLQKNSHSSSFVFFAGFGYGNVRRKQLVSPDHQFRVGSVSKPITAAAILLCRFFFGGDRACKWNANGNVGFCSVVDSARLALDQHVFGPGNSIFGWCNVE